MAARGCSFSLYLYSKKACEHPRSHIFCPMIMKLGVKIGFIYISDEFANGPDRSKNMSARGGGVSFPYVAREKPCDRTL